MTDLQQFILSVLVEDGKVDPDVQSSIPVLLGHGLTAKAIAERSDGYYGLPTVVRALNAMCKPTVGNADNAPRGPWCRQITGEIARATGVPENGPRREWVATPEGAAAVGS